MMDVASHFRILMTLLTKFLGTVKMDSWLEVHVKRSVVLEHGYQIRNAQKLASVKENVSGRVK